MYNNPIENIKPEEILIYLRKSRADDPLLSVEEVLANHEARLDEWVERNLGVPIPSTNRYKELVSGESISDREEFQKVLKRIESPDIKAVLVVNISRLGRPDTAEIGLISKIFRYTHTSVITPERTFNIADNFEREMFETELKHGNFYLEATKKQLGMGRESSVKSGNWICSKAPYGYDKITITENKRKCPTLAINEERANVVNMIFNWYVHENIGTQVISNRLNEMNIKPPKSTVWTPDSIRTILENPVYIGKVRWNERKAVLVVDNGEFRKTRPKAPEEERILSDGKHEAIISEDIFYAAQEKRGRNHRTCDNKELRNPLASILYCECGRAMSYRHSTRGNLKYRREPRLCCNGQKHCGNGSCSVSEMMDFVENLLKKTISDFEIKVGNCDEETNTFHEKHLKNLENKLSDLNAREITLWESQVNPNPENRMPTHVFQALVDKLTKEREETEIAITKTKETLSTPINYEKKLVTFKMALEALQDENKSAAEKNLFLKACIDKIEYRREAPQKVLGKGVGRQWIFSPMKLDVTLNMRPTP